MLTQEAREFHKDLPEDLKQAFLDFLKREGRDPLIYELLAWSVGILGAHHWYLGRKKMAGLQCCSILLATILAVLAIFYNQMNLLGIGFFLTGFAAMLWGLSLLTIRKDVQSFRKELELGIVKKASHASQETEAA